MGSRKEVRRMILEGRVQVNGEVVRSKRARFPENVPISIDGCSITEVEFYFLPYLFFCDFLCFQCNDLIGPSISCVSQTLRNSLHYG